MKKNQRKNNSQKKEESRKVVRQHLNEMLVDVKKLLNVALFFAVLSIIVFIFQSWCVAKLFAYLMNTRHEAIPLNHHYIVSLFICIVLSMMIRPMLQYIRERFSQKASYITRCSLQKKLINKLSQLGPESSQYGSEGVLSSKLMDQIDSFDGYISRYYVQFFLVVISPILILFTVSFYSIYVSLIMFLTAPMVVVFMILVGSSAAKKSREQFNAMGRLSGSFLDFVRGMKTILHFNAENEAVERIERTAEEYRIRTMQVLKLAFLSTGVLEFFSAISIAVVALYLGLGLMGQIPWESSVIIIPYEGALFILLLAPEFYAPLRILGSEYHARALAEGAIEEILPILEEKAWEHPGKENIQLLEAPAIDVNQVSILSKKGNKRLNHINLHVNQGERVLLMGRSGVGKSSLLEAILGFLPYEGNITINQQSLMNIDRSQWHHYVAYLSQSPRFLAGTIASNLRLVKPSASDEELINVLKEVYLFDLIDKLPQKLNSNLGERGIGLSGGQLSRLSLAQLLITKSHVWLLDEPTEHLDHDSASTIHELLNKVSKDKTMILVSHQERSLEWIDRKIEIR